MTGWAPVDGFHQEPPRPKVWQAANPNYRTAKLRTVDPITLDGKAIPERQWIVQDWMPHGQVTMLGGDGGTGKTLLAQMLATACATGGTWLGMPVMPCRALAILCEDDADELHRRQDAINRTLDIDWSDLGNLKWVSRVGEDNALMTFERDIGAPTEFFQQIHNTASDFGAGLVVLDSLHDLFAGNENVRTHARQFISLLRGLARDIDGAVLLSAHPSMSGRNTGTGESGSTAWSNSVRSRLYLSRPESDSPDTEERILSRKKSNYARIGDTIRMGYRAGAFVNLAAPVGVIGAIERRKAEAVFIDLLARREGEGRPVSAKARSGNYAPTEFARHRHREGFTKREFERAMEQLFAAGKVQVMEYGPASKRREKIVLTEVS